MSVPVTTAPPPRLEQDGPSLAELMTAMPVTTLVITPDNRIADANVRAETLLNMARSAIVGSDISRTIRMAEMGARGKVLIILPLAVATAVYLLFVVLLNSNIPHGPIERLFS